MAKRHDWNDFLHERFLLPNQAMYLYSFSNFSFVNLQKIKIVAALLV